MSASFAVPVKQVNRNGVVYVQGASAFKPPTMVQGGTYFGSVRAYRSAMGRRKPLQVEPAKMGGHPIPHYDASDVIARRRRIAIGKNATRFGLKNTEPSQWKSNGRTVRNSRLARARSGGSVAPKKKGAY